MASAVTVCNLALSHFGEEKINALTETAATSNENVAKCLVYYDQARQEVLERQSWTFARKRAACARVTDAPAFDWDYEHTLPADCLRVLEVRSGALASDGETVSYGRGKVDKFEIEDGGLLSNHSYIAVRYIYDCPVDGWTHLATAALARLLAGYLAEAITGDVKRADYHRRIYEDIDLPNAQHHDAVQDQSNENHPLLDRLDESLLVGARSGGLGLGQFGTSGATSGTADVDELEVGDDW